MGFPKRLILRMGEVVLSGLDLQPKGALMFGRIKRFFVGTTGLTPIMPVPQVSKDVFIAVFATPPGVEPYNPFQQAGPEKKTIRDAAFETAMETIRRASQVPAILMEAAQRAGAVVLAPEPV